MASPTPRTPQTLLLVTVVAVVLVSTAAVTGGATGIGDVGSRDVAAAGPGSGLDSAQFSDPDDDGDGEDNGTQQVDPDDAGENGDSEAVAGRLADSLASRLSEGQVAISEGDYERGRELFGDEYDEELAMYVDVRGDTEGDSEEMTADEFREARQEQRQLANQTEQYDDTYREYREAKRNGNEERARELARDLQRQAEAINETAESLNRSYGNISTNTGSDLDTAQRELAEVRENVSERVSEVEREAFVATRLAVTANQTDISFSNPVRFTGTLTAENGTAIANRTVRVSIGVQTLTAETDANGQFSILYRPVGVRTGEGNLSIAYEPLNASQYLGSQALVAVNVSQVTPTVTAETSVTAVSYGDSVRIGGTVTVDGVPARSVPIDVYVDDHWVGRVTTDADGGFDVVGVLPVTVVDGDREVRAEIALDGGALAATNGTTTLTVEPTATDVTVSATRVSEGENATNEFVLSGSARADDGRPLANQTVVVTLGDGLRTVTRTDANGTFETRLSVPESQVPQTGEETVTITAQLRTAGTSLLASDATTEVVLVGPEAASDGSRFPVPLLPTVLGLAALGVVGGVIAFRTRSKQAPVSGDGTPDGSTDPDAATSSEATSGPPLAAFDAESADPDTTVRVAYESLRAKLAEDVSVPATSTHAEFYAACQEADVETETLRAVERVVSLYERALFAPAGVSVGAATDALDAVASVADVAEEDSGQEPPGPDS